MSGIKQKKIVHHKSYRDALFDHFLSFSLCRAATFCQVPSLDESHAEQVDEQLGRRPGESAPGENQDQPSARTRCDWRKGPARCVHDGPVWSSSPLGHSASLHSHYLTILHNQATDCVLVFSCDAPCNMENSPVMQMCTESMMTLCWMPRLWNCKLEQNFSCVFSRQHTSRRRTLDCEARVWRLACK